MTQYQQDMNELVSRANVSLHPYHLFLYLLHAIHGKV